MWKLKNYLGCQRWNSGQSHARQAPSCCTMALAPGNFGLLTHGRNSGLEKVQRLPDTLHYRAVVSIPCSKRFPSHQEQAPSNLEVSQSSTWCVPAQLSLPGQKNRKGEKNPFLKKYGRGPRAWPKGWNTTVRGTLDLFLVQPPCACLPPMQAALLW